MKRSSLLALLSLWWVHFEIGLAHAADPELHYDRTLYAAPASTGDASGRNEGNPMRLEQALAALGNIPTRIVLLDGSYRGQYAVGAGTNALALEALHAGRAVITGSDPVTNWVALDGGAYAFPWAQRWGLNREQFFFPGERTRFNQRRELLFVEGTRLTQRVDEARAGAAIPTAELKPGEFTVDEAAGQMRFKPPATVSMGPGTRLEVGVRGYGDGLYPNDGSKLLAIKQRSNVLIRGLVFQHSVNFVKANAALEIEGERVADPAAWTSGIVIDRCAFNQNNGIGLLIGGGIRDIVIRHTTMNDNGSRGGGSGLVRNLLLEDCEFSRNGWRFAPWLVGHDNAGWKHYDGGFSDGWKAWYLARSEAITVRRCRFSANQGVGYWSDYGATDQRIESCLFENSRHAGLMIEITPGPVTVTDSVFRRLGQHDNKDWPEAAVLIVGSPRVAFDRCTFFDNGPAAGSGGPIFNLVNDTRRAEPESDSTVRDFQLVHSTVQASRPGTFLFRAGTWNNAAHARKTFAETAVMDHNTYFNANRSAWSYEKGELAFMSAKIFGDWKDAFPDLTFTEWQAFTPNLHGRQDQHSTWTEVRLDTLESIDPTRQGPVTSPAAAPPPSR